MLKFFITDMEDFMKKEKMTISGTDLILNSSDKLGRHNTMQKSHVHQTEKDKMKNRNSKKAKRELNKIKKDYL